MTDKKLIIEWKYIYRGLCAMILTAIAGGSFFYVWRRFVAYFAEHGVISDYLRGNGNLLMSLGIYVGLYLFLGHGLRAFAIGVERTTNIAAAQVLTIFLTDVCEIFASMAVSGRWRFWGQFVSKYMRLFLLQSVALVIASVFLIMLYRNLFPATDVIELYGRENGLYDKVNRLQFKYHITESIYVHGQNLDDIIDRIQGHQAVLINDIPSSMRNKILKACFRMDKRVYVVPKISDIIMKGSEPLNLFDTPMFLCRNREISWWQRIVKRVSDIVLSLAALIILSPLLLITALAIKIEDHGPVLYKQERVTRGGKAFHDAEIPLNDS